PAAHVPDLPRIRNFVVDPVQYQSVLNVEMKQEYRNAFAKLTTRASFIPTSTRLRLEDILTESGSSFEICGVRDVGASENGLRDLEVYVNTGVLVATRLSRELHDSILALLPTSPYVSDLAEQDFINW
ncbi:hypothetical protein HK405_013948, partial [Cladochytrium tenue]